MERIVGNHMVFKGERRVGGISCHQKGINEGPIENFECQ